MTSLWRDWVSSLAAHVGRPEAVAIVALTSFVVTFIVGLAIFVVADLVGGVASWVRWRRDTRWYRRGA